MAPHDPVSKQTDVDLPGEVLVDGSFSCELVESHYGPVHVVAVQFLAVPCLSFGISAPSLLVCFYIFGYPHRSLQVLRTHCIFGAFSLAHEIDWV
jgi:hypothetical protein